MASPRARLLGPWLALLAGCAARASPPDARLEPADAPTADGGFDARAREVEDADLVDPAPGLDAWGPDAWAGDTWAGDTWAGDAGPAVLHDCREFEDRSAPESDRTVRFGSSGSYSYEPACMRVAPGQTVAFAGRFTHHPLAPGRSPLRPLDPTGSPETPMVAVEDGELATVTFPVPGDYPYHCPVHDHLGMWGVVRVE